MSNSVTASPTPALPFLLTTKQGHAARTLLSYVAALPLSSPDAQLLAVTVAIRAARGGVGNLTGIDLRSMKLTDPEQVVADLRGLGWQIPDQLLVGDPESPVSVTVPALTAQSDHPLPFGKQMRSRVSGWTTRTLAAKPVRKASPATRLAALFLAAHASSMLNGTLPSDLPGACRTALPDLLVKNFLTDLSGDHYRLDAGVRHLTGLLPHPADPEEPAAPAPPRRVAEQPQISPAEWAQWKAQVSPALRRHAEAVENCPVCKLPADQVATAFTATRPLVPSPRHVREAYGVWKEQHPERGPLAAQFTVAFRAEHGHGPSYNQLCTGLGWNLPRTVRTFIVRRLLANEWLTETAPKPWTLRPGNTAQAHGISLPPQVRSRS
ncbi:hypothetical protein [Streptomyces griseus]|uniref:hypothetical protein n=1 Tax=Streptomyces griseus TaxID=1911 RepID=UPI0005649012|nr:hypothetical protein [Streptomyces griseus]